MTALPRNGAGEECELEGLLILELLDGLPAELDPVVEPGGANVAAGELERDLPRVDPDRPQARE